MSAMNFTRNAESVRETGDERVQVLSANGAMSGKNAPLIVCQEQEIGSIRLPKTLDDLASELREPELSFSRREIAHQSTLQSVVRS